MSTTTKAKTTTDAKGKGTGAKGKGQGVPAMEMHLPAFNEAQGKPLTPEERMAVKAKRLNWLRQELAKLKAEEETLKVDFEKETGERTYRFGADAYLVNTKSDTQMRTDGDAVKARYAELGEKVPTKPVVAVSVRVKKLETEAGVPT